MLSESQKREREIKVLSAIKNYMKVSNLCELSEITKISTSSLQRYLTIDAKEILNKEDYEKVINWLNIAKRNGLKNGGKRSQKLFGYGKDSNGHFNGRKK